MRRAVALLDQISAIANGRLTTLGEQMQQMKETILTGSLASK